MADNSIKIRKKDSIVFQLLSLNLLMLVAFFAVMALVISSMMTSTNTSISMFSNMMTLTQHEAQLKNDVMSLYDQATGYVSADAVETKTALMPQIQVAKDAVNADIAALNQDFSGIQNEAATAQLAEISAQYGRFSALIDSAITKCDAGDQASAYTILFDKAEMDELHAASL